MAALLPPPTQQQEPQQPPQQPQPEAQQPEPQQVQQQQPEVPRTEQRLRPDGRTRVMIEYVQRADDFVELQKIHAVVISMQYAEPSEATRRRKVMKRTPQEIISKSGEPVIALSG